MRVPLVDLKAQYRAHREQIDAAIAAVIDTSAYIGGEFVRSFESQFAAACGTTFCVGCGNGTDAIYVILRMLGIGPGDEVITTAMSWISTSETISQAGATPVFVDVDSCYGIDAGLIESRITARTRAIIPVHLYGQAADMGPITAIAAKHGLVVIEDCAQAHLATLHGRGVGTFGVAGTFSFYPGKNLGAYGDAGAIVTSDSQLAERARMYANHGALVKHEHAIEGINSRLDGLQAAILAAKLARLREWTERRGAVATMYTQRLQDVPEVATPQVRAGAQHVYHLYVVQAQERERLREHLRSHGIETQIHYPRPLPFLPCYSRLGARADDFPAAAALQSRILSLPMYAELTEAQIDHVTGSIRQFYRSVG
jgi:dTDP-4-amino-4,6-dideoxygalactose transaminase